MYSTTVYWLVRTFCPSPVRCISYYLLFNESLMEIDLANSLRSIFALLILGISCLTPPLPFTPGYDTTVSALPPTRR